jgi:hypothetical protein
MGGWKDVAARSLPPPMKFPRKDPFPGAKDFGELSEAVEPPVGHRNHFSAHHLVL